MSSERKPPDATDLIDWLRHAPSTEWNSPMLNKAADEIERLREWLSYIEGNFRNGPECAREALRGDPLPEGFRP